MESNFMIDKERKQRLDDTMRFSLRDWQATETEKMKIVNRSNKIQKAKRKHALIASVFNKNTYCILIDALKIKSHSNIQIQ